MEEEDDENSDCDRLRTGEQGVRGRECERSEKERGPCGLSDWDLKWEGQEQEDSAAMRKSIDPLTRFSFFKGQYAIGAGGDSKNHLDGCVGCSFVILSRKSYTTTSQSCCCDQFFCCAVFVDILDLREGAASLRSISFFFC